MSKLLATIKSRGENFTSQVFLHNDGRVSFVGDADIDCDGGPNPLKDPFWQSDTALHHLGKPINSELVPGIVVPPEILNGVKPIVLGCKAQVTNRKTGKTELAVVFDVGPHSKVGEISPALAKLIGVNPNPINGGEDDPVLLYELWPGIPAVVKNITYTLQPSK